MTAELDGLMPAPELTEENLHERCAYWQRELRLEDWSVAVAILPASELPEDSQAHIEHQTALRSALLGLCSPEDYPRTEPFVRDWEQSVVHELLHIHTDVFGAEPGSPRGIAEEQAVDALARALVRLDRGEVDVGPLGKKPPDPASNLQGAVWWWKQVIGLRDWRVMAEFVPRRHWHDDAERPTGYCNADTAAQSAVIHLIHPREYQGGASFPEDHDVEVALLHEMLHMHLHQIWDGDAEGLKYDMQERCGEIIAQALVNAARRRGR